MSYIPGRWANTGLGNGGLAQLIIRFITLVYNTTMDSISRFGTVGWALKILSLTIFTIFPALAKAKDLSFTSSANQVALLELYSSEGCSSCPPADQFFASLRENKNLWSSFVPVGFHVDYWDRLGWVDKLAQKEFTQRQRLYARFWNSNRVYTPGLVLNGNEWKQWRNGISLPPQQSAGVLQLTARPSGKVSAVFSPQKTLKRPQLFVALLANGVSSKVLTGENAGRTCASP